MKPEDFWHSSLREALFVIDGYLYRSQVTFRLGVAGSWMAAAWSRAKRMPNLNQVMMRLDRAAAPQPAPEDQRRDFETLAKDMAPDLLLPADTGSE